MIVGAELFYAHITHSQQHDFISENLRYGRPYQEEKTFSMEKILKDHIARSWPEKLLQLVTTRNDDKALQDTIKQHQGKHCHEPMIARVLQKAAAGNKYDIVQRLLDDGVHPDVRIKKEEKTAFELAGPEVRKLLYERGAKTHPAPPSIPWTCWPGIDSKHYSVAATPPQDVPKDQESSSSGMGDEQFRALIVDIYSLISDNASKKPTSKESAQSKQEESSKEQSTPNRPDCEYYCIAHPTVEDLIYREGPDAIMRTQFQKIPSEGYKRYRWIHLPMNHVS
jgi:hypothetical protein